MRISMVVVAVCLAAFSTPAFACQDLTPEGVRLYQDVEVRGVVTVTGANTAVLIPEQVRHGVHRKRYEITWEPRQDADGLPVFQMICNEWVPTDPQVRGTFHLQRKHRRGPVYVVLRAQTDDPQ
jgi:hypothetical protein